MSTPATDRSPTIRGSRLTSTDLLAAAGVLAVGASFALSPDHIEDGPVLCPFRLLTGLPCPGCGLTRSWVYAAHGWWGESFAAHPFGMVAAAAVLLGIAATVATRVRRRRPLDMAAIDKLAKHPVVLGVVAVWLVYAVVRLVQAV